MNWLWLRFFCFIICLTHFSTEAPIQKAIEYEEAEEAYDYADEDANNDGVENQNTLHEKSNVAGVVDENDADNQASMSENLNENGIESDSVQGVVAEEKLSVDAAKESDSAADVAEDGFDGNVAKESDSPAAVAEGGLDGDAAKESDSPAAVAERGDAKISESAGNVRNSDTVNSVAEISKEQKSNADSSLVGNNLNVGSASGQKKFNIETQDRASGAQELNDDVKDSGSAAYKQLNVQGHASVLEKNDDGSADSNNNKRYCYATYKNNNNDKANPSAVNTVGDLKLKRSGRNAGSAQLNEGYERKDNADNIKAVEGN